MTGLSCIRAEAWLGRRAAGLSAAEQLRLEEHLAECAGCSAQAQLLDGMRELAAAGTRTLSPEARARVIGAAVREARQHGSAPRAALRPALAAGLSAAALALFVLGWAVLQPPGEETIASRDRGEQRASADTAETSSHAAEMLSGELTAAEGGDGVTALRAGHSVYSERGARLSLGHAIVELAAMTRLRFDAEQTRVHLDAGAATVAIDPTKHERFEVQTQHFIARALGTRFTVERRSVVVSHGKVRVLSPTGEILADELAAGERYEYPVVSDPPSEPAESTRTRTARGEKDHGSVRPNKRSGGTNREVGPDRPTADPRELLSRARAELAAGDLDAGKRTIDAAWTASKRPQHRAEALTLRAEWRRLGRDTDHAVADYLEVAKRFPRLKAAETALFAAARLEANRGRSEAARRLFTRYLERYPEGSFSRAARSRLRSLGDTTHGP